MDDMNDSSSWAHGIKCYGCSKQLMAMANMNNFRSWDQGIQCYQKLKGVDDMNDLGAWV